jgi:peptidoglycan hydrolase CwlO-like protein
MGSHLVNDPLDLEAKILDMKVKINYISKQISEYNEKGTSEAYEKKYLQLENKIKKLENRNRQYN